MKGKQFYLMLTFDLPNICHVGEVNHCIYLASCAWTRHSLFRLLPTYVLPSLVKKKKQTLIVFSLEGRNHGQ